MPAGEIAALVLAVGYLVVEFVPAVWKMLAMAGWLMLTMDLGLAR